MKFLLSGELTRGFEKLSDAVRKGGTADTELGTTAAEHPVWVEFARAMAPLMMPGSQALAEMVPLDESRPSKVLDISASHGMWGIAFAKKYRRASLVAVDWAPVLEVTRENAQQAGVADRVGDRAARRRRRVRAVHVHAHPELEHVGFGHGGIVR